MSGRWSPLLRDFADPAVERPVSRRRIASTGGAGRPGRDGLALLDEVREKWPRVPLRLVASARTLKEIAAELRLSEKTIATYRARISAKIGASTNVELTRYPLRHKLVE
ncbi:LuxR C-terminal-related transcriptional regulator [Anaeromyxobacter sp. Fw109-5]|uniref:response regulator transcription factor n=1 Tax=Anaeromyxobacter sp. (strain Fw109-5) TaxID=404589 RepID=UPI000A05B740